MQAMAAALNYPAKKSLYVNKAVFLTLFSHKGSFLRPEGGNPTIRKSAETPARAAPDTVPLCT